MTWTYIRHHICLIYQYQICQPINMSYHSELEVFYFVFSHCRSVWVNKSSLWWSSERREFLGRKQSISAPVSSRKIHVWFIYLIYHTWILWGCLSFCFVLSFVESFRGPGMQSLSHHDKETMEKTYDYVDNNPIGSMGLIYLSHASVMGIFWDSMWA